MQLCVKKLKTLLIKRTVNKKNDRAAMKRETQRAGAGAKANGKNFLLRERSSRNCFRRGLFLELHFYNYLVWKGLLKHCEKHCTHIENMTEFSHTHFALFNELRQMSDWKCLRNLWTKIICKMWRWTTGCKWNKCSVLSDSEVTVKIHRKYKARVQCVLVFHQCSFSF